MTTSSTNTENLRYFRFNTRHRARGTMRNCNQNSVGKWHSGRMPLFLRGAETHGEWKSISAINHWVLTPVCISMGSYDDHNFHTTAWLRRTSIFGLICKKWIQWCQWKVETFSLTSAELTCHGCTSRDSLRLVKLGVVSFLVTGIFGLIRCESRWILL